MYNKIFLISSVLAISSCSKEDPILEGTRTDLSVETKQIVVDTDPSFQNMEVVLGRPISVKNWTIPVYNVSGLIPHLEFSCNFNKIDAFDAGAAAWFGRLILHSPVVKDGMMVVSDAKGAVRKIDLSSRNIVWTSNFSQKEEDKNLVVTGVSLLNKTGFVSIGKRVIAFDLESGSKKWETKLESISRIFPMVSEDSVYVAGVDGTLSVLLAETGAIKWQHKAPAEDIILLGGSNVAVSNSSIVIPSPSGELFSVAKNGTPLWSDQVGNPTVGSVSENVAQFYPNVAIDGSIIFADSHANAFGAYGLKSGSKIWEQPVVSFQSPIITPSHLFVVDRFQQVLCLEKTSGQAKWIKSLETSVRYYTQEEAPIFWYGPLLLSGKIAVFSSKGTVVLLDPKTGNELNRLELDHDIAIAPIVVDGKCYITKPNNTIVVYE